MGNPRRTNGHRRNELIKRVRARDDFCWLCKAPIDKSLKTPHPMSPEVHEVIPVSRGGSALALDNCVLTHRRCNNWIGNRTPSELHGKTAPTIPVATSIAW